MAIRVGVAGHPNRGAVCRGRERAHRLVEVSAQGCRPQRDAEGVERGHEAGVCLGQVKRKRAVTDRGLRERIATAHHGHAVCEQRDREALIDPRTAHAHRADADEREVFTFTFTFTFTLSFSFSFTFRRCPSANAVAARVAARAVGVVDAVS